MINKEIILTRQYHQKEIDSGTGAAVQNFSEQPEKQVLLDLSVQSLSHLLSQTEANTFPDGTSGTFSTCQAGGDLVIGVETVTGISKKVSSRSTWISEKPSKK